MLYNYLKTALRNLSKYFTYTFINISGLAVGITASLLVFIYVAHDFSTDRFHKNLDNIHILSGKLDFSGHEINITGMSPNVGSAIDEASSDVLSFVRINHIRRASIKINNDHLFFEKNFIFADPSFLSIFSFPLLHGDLSTCLSNPNTVVITERAAHKYFGEADPIGKTILYNAATLMQVTGVVKNPPSNSSINFDFIGSFTSLGGIAEEKAAYNESELTSGQYQTYFLVDNSKTTSAIEQMANKLVSRNTGGDVKFSLTLKPFAISKLYFGDDIEHSEYTKIFLGVAIMILFLALINYVNLTTARSTVRAKEVGVRKVSGAPRKAIIYQFYGESILFTTIAFILAIAFVQIVSEPLFNLLQIRIDSSFIASPLTISMVIALYLICIILGGSYPALVLSRFIPAHVLKGKTSVLQHGAILRKSLTVLQFTISIGLIFCSIIIQQQLEFMQNQKIGMNKDQTLVVSLDKDNDKNYLSIKNQVAALTNIAGVTGASSKLFTQDGTIFPLKTKKTNQSVFINYMIIDKDFVESMGITWFQKPQEDIKPGNWILNRAAVAQLELDSLPAGQQFESGQGKSHLLNGVMENFNFNSLHSSVGPMIFLIMDENKPEETMFGLNLYITFNNLSNLQDQVSKVKAIVSTYDPDSPFEYYFLDDAFNNLYKSEDRMSAIFSFFTGIAIIIACMGLFGLITLASEMRTKEISIRKVLGASVRNITALLSRQFIVLVLISCAVSGPIAYLLMNRWLENFAFRIHPGVLAFLTASALAVLISIIVISTQAIRAAVANPVDSLRND